jgi:hypothetical protein
MPTYKITYTETYTSTYTIDADTEDDAHQQISYHDAYADDGHEYCNGGDTHQLKLQRELEEVEVMYMHSVQLPIDLWIKHFKDQGDTQEEGVTAVLFEFSITTQWENEIEFNSNLNTDRELKILSIDDFINCLCYAGKVKELDEATQDLYDSLWEDRQYEIAQGFSLAVYGNTKNASDYDGDFNEMLVKCLCDLKATKINEEIIF